MRKQLLAVLIVGFLVSNYLSIQANASELKPEQTNTSEAFDADEEKEENLNSNLQEMQEDADTDDETLSQTEVDSEIKNITETESENDSQLQEEPISAESSTVNADMVSDTKPNKPTDLKWNPDKPGSFSFNKNNSPDTKVCAYIYKDGKREFAHDAEGFYNVICNTDISYSIEESGDYMFRIHVLSDNSDMFDESKGVLSDYSDVFHYVKPEQKIESPEIKWDLDNPGTVRWNFVDHSSGYLVNISNDDFQSWTMVSGTNYDIPEEDFSSVMEPGKTYKVRIKVYSDNINLYTHSDYAVTEEYYYTGSGNFGNENNASDDSGNYVPNTYSASEEPVEVAWTPTTEEEKTRYLCYGKEKVEYTTKNDQLFDVNIQNAMQGKQCFEVFENAAGNYTIARTYNIYPLGSKEKYATEEKVTISLVVPETLRKQNREFKMICVSQDGIPFIFDDKDKDPDTITFSTDKFYAYALIYKDAE